MPFQDNAFSVTSFAMAIHHMDMTKAIAEATRVVVPNGYIIVVTDNPEKGTWHAELSNTICLAENRREPHFPKIGELTDCFYTAGLGDITIKHFPISIEYTISEYIEMLLNKPFSTALLMSDIEWSKACYEVKKALLEKYGNLEELIQDEIVYSVIAGRKMATEK